jgi:hypothetical protein
MYGKAVTHMIRISAIINCLESAFHEVTHLPLLNKHNLCKELDTEIEKVFLKKSAQRFRITTENLISAKNLVDYFILNRLILAGYSSNLNYDTISENISSILKKVCDRDSIKNMKLFQVILMQDGELVECKELINGKKCGKDSSSEIIVQAFKDLERSGIGYFEERANKSGPSTKCFRKVQISAETLNKNELIEFLELIDIDVTSYMEHFNKKSIINFNFCLKW